MNNWPAGVPPLPAAIPDDRPVALLMRHGERPPIAAGEPGTDLALTARGREHAGALGRALGSRLRRLHTSPVRRCQETAEALRAGAGATTPIVADRLLGDPGVFVLDPERAWENWRTLGNQGVIEHLAWGTAALSGLADPSCAALELASHLLDSVRDGEVGLHVFVTHDALLLPTLTRLVAAVTDRSWWPGCLESAAFWNTSALPRLAYRALDFSLKGQVQLEYRRSSD